MEPLSGNLCPFCKYSLNIVPETVILENKQKKEIASFKCVYCSYTLPIKEGTLVYSSNFEQTNTFDSDANVYKNLINDPTLLRIKNYDCPNKDCDTHKDKNLKKAVFSRIGDTFKLIFVCTVCETIWYKHQKN